MLICKTIRPAAVKDISWIVSQEQREDFKAFIHHWPEKAHQRNLADPDMRYLIAVDGDARRLAFVILGGVTSPERSIELARMAVERPGAGIGKALLRQVIHLAFAELCANRLWLDVFEDNSRARRVYRSVGFKEEGLLREAALKGNGRIGSLVIMSILAREFMEEIEVCP